MSDVPNRIKIKPVEGGRVRHPGGKLLRAEGETVTRSVYWDRRLLHSDVVEVKDDAGTAAQVETGADNAVAKKGDSK